MPIRPPPREIRCPQCGWHQVWQPASDALAVSDLPPERCPRCDCADLQVRPASPAAALWEQLKRRITPT